MSSPHNLPKNIVVIGAGMHSTLRVECDLDSIRQGWSDSPPP